jgi:hypothetical protein
LFDFKFAMGIAGFSVLDAHLPEFPGMRRRLRAIGNHSPHFCDSLRRGKSNPEMFKILLQA